MSRSATGGELTTLALPTRQITHRIKVQNGSGTMIDLSSWLERGKINRDVDQPVDGCTIAFTRAHGPTQSLSPLRTDSTLNVNDVPAYSPLLDLNRVATVELATTAIGAAIVAGDYKLLFKGTIDVVNFEQSPVVITCRDLGAPLVDRWIEAEATFGTGVPGSGVGGRSIQLVMQDILDAVFGAGVYPLYTPVSPGADLNTYRQQRMSVMDALQDLAQQIGWDVRFRWDDGTSAFRLTLSEPPRAKTTPDYTFGPSAYHDITELSLDITDIRNAITGSYRNANNLGNRENITVTDATSISKYGRRFMLIQEADVSPIDSSAEMTTMLNSALADLKEPKANQSVNFPLHWTADLWDLYRYSANSVHYNSNQDIAVVELTHEFAPNYHRTTAVVRGTPIGQYTTWRGRGGPIGGPVNGTTGQAFAPYPFIVPLNTEGSDATWDLRFNAINGTGGGGTNLTYTIKSKETFGTETTLASGNASAFPDDVTVTRDPKNDQVITFTVTDAATGMFAVDKFTVPAFVPAITGAGNVVSDYFEVGTVSTRNRCKVYNSVLQTISNATLTTLLFDSEGYDVGGLHSTSSNTGRITIPAGGDTGVWILTLQVTWAGNAVGYRAIEIFDSAAAQQAISTISPAPAATTTTQQITLVVNAPAVGEYYYGAVVQTSSGNLDVSGGVGATYFSATHLW